MTTAPGAEASARVVVEVEPLPPLAGRAWTLYET